MASLEGMEYAWPSTVGVANFVTVKPCVEGEDRSDFKIWRKQMLCLLESQEVTGFVDGRIPPPLDQDEERQKMMWRRTDMLVQGWILGSIGKDALDVVWDKPTAREMWLELESIFKEREEEEEEEVSNDNNKESADVDFRKYSTLYQAAMRGDWNTAMNFFPDISQLDTTVISSKLETTLHIAVMAGKSNDDFVKKLVQLMPPEALAIRDSGGNTALHNAACTGNTEAAKAMVEKNPDLLYSLNDTNQLPIMLAILRSHKETVDYLAFEGQTDIIEFNAIISCGFVDIALHLAHKYPDLALLREGNSIRRSALLTISQTPELFQRTDSFSWWKKLIYRCIPLEKSKLYEADSTCVGRDDLESLSSHGATHKDYSIASLFKVFISRVPKVKELSEKKATLEGALQLAQFLCNKIHSLPENEAMFIFQQSIMSAAKYGISEIVEMIIQKCPNAMFAREAGTGKSMFMLATTYRFENVINIFYNMSNRKYIFYDSTDNEENNLLHICGKLAPPNRLNLVAGAALQMQRELQWFKEMENFVSPSRRTWLNKEKLTPQEIFTEEHKQLKADGERWMKDTANACTIAASLIATVMFAAAFTLPGGLDSSTGIPLFKKKPSFMLFAVSDAVSLFTSITSLLMFLSILTSRYAEEDFLYVLPKRLSIGLLSLFVSITFMMVAFSATLYLVFRRDAVWFLVLLAAFACFPAMSFVLLQFPLLVDVIYSTYSPGIFGKKSDRILY